jgi:hypothetical protein
MAVYQVGERFRESKRKSVAVFECECGVRFVGRTDMKPVSCGCQTKRNQSEAAKRRPANRKTHGMFGTKVYRVWSSMIQRCSNPNNDAWDNYGGRGIRVCSRWEKFEQFYSDMGDPNGLTLERKDSNGMYEPANCIWASPQEQACNRRSNVKTTIDGITKTASDWSKETGTHPRKRIAENIKAGKTGREAVFK